MMAEFEEAMAQNHSNTSPMIDSSPNHQIVYSPYNSLPTPRSQREANE